MQVIEATIEKHKQNSQTFKAFGGSLGQDEDPSLSPDLPVVSTSSEEPVVAADAGVGAAGLEPRRVSSKMRRDKEKQCCKGCGETFNSITKRRHRCKPCGAVICGKCSEFKTEQGRQSRFCRECFLSQPGTPGSPSPEEPAGSKQNLEKLTVADSQPSLLCGPLRVSEDGVTWNEVWASIPTSEPLELVLRTQGDSQGSQPPHTICLPGCRVSLPDPAEKLDAGHTWRLQQARQRWYLSASSAELQQQWMEALSTAARGERIPASPADPQPQVLAAP